MRNIWAIYKHIDGYWKRLYSYPSLSAAMADFQRRGLSDVDHCINTI